MTDKSLVRTDAPRALRTWDPFYRFFDRDLLGPSSLMESLFGETVGAARGFWPPVDVNETDEAYEVYAELPGMSKKDVEVTLENNVLTLTGERRVEEQFNRGTSRRSERAYGRFSRAFSLPRAVDATRVKANFKDGILTLVIPKAEEARPRKIDIS